jgi:hypoxanthine phosphoribosyltransferase
MLAAQEAWKVLREADIVCTEAQVGEAMHRLAAEIGARLAESVPLVLGVMGGGVVFTGQLLPLLKFPLEFDYIHVTRYRGSTEGGEIRWKVEPRASVAGRTVLVLDDILDEGHTAASIKAWLQRQGAEDVLFAVFADKAINREKPVTADFVGVSVPDRYVFGFGMDVNDAWRNLPAIYALKDRD